MQEQDYIVRLGSNIYVLNTQAFRLHQAYMAFVAFLIIVAVFYSGNSWVLTAPAAYIAGVLGLRLIAKYRWRQLSPEEATTYNTLESSPLLPAPLRRGWSSVTLLLALFFLFVSVRYIWIALIAHRSPLIGIEMGALMLLYIGLFVLRHRMNPK